MPPYEELDLKLGGLLALNLHEFSNDVEEINDMVRYTVAACPSKPISRRVHSPRIAWEEADQRQRTLKARMRTVIQVVVMVA